ncbi:hypothetical protein ACFFMR_13220 [Micromonospora andamanensis]|uniref:Uncharacterized protein n=1 Tax=Micromonospora andamanensis TaxID=1287068 RepID=A0ABQ4HN78_9ACTN|nr:hypothetical protein [Micromonospora andamanensis]GIJ07097.1 hypothetical protein Van01_03110 [Micromonospora andamanensis]GIJ40383.1 hypothetical protein Vwe01_37080 [Micromonospora andamanensis]
MERPLIAVLLLVGLIIGSGVGSSYARARRGWNDYQAAKKTVPGARRAAWMLIKVVTTKVGVIALLLIGAVAYAAAGGGDEPAPAAPTPSSSADERPTR